jgi:hypothetical protein
MWEIFQKILAEKLTPNQALILFAMKQKVALSYTSELDKHILESNGWLKKAPDDIYEMTPEAKLLCTKLDNYFIKAKKRTDIQLMGKDFVEKINQYREIFPAKKLPSGKPARQNVKALGSSFRWFFETYDHTWADLIKATRMYVNEYRDKDYQYMMTSQYFVSKQDKHKVKHSTLADYCDLIKEGTDTEDKHFKEKVV